MLDQPTGYVRPRHGARPGVEGSDLERVAVEVARRPIRPRRASRTRGRARRPASRTTESVMSVPSSRLIANQSQPPPTEMKSPHWWSNQAMPVDVEALAVERQLAGRREPRPRVVVRRARRPEVDEPVAVVQRRGLGRGEGEAQPERAAGGGGLLVGERRLDRSVAGGAGEPPRVRERPVRPRRSSSGFRPATCRSNPLGVAGVVARRAIDLRADLAPLRVA